MCAAVLELAKGARVWYRKDDQTWLAGELAAPPAAVCSVLLDGGSVIEVDGKLLLPGNPKVQDGIEDLTQLSHLNEPAILQNLQARYAEDSIYTFAGPVLVAVNPCKYLPLYTSEVAEKYKGTS